MQIKISIFLFSLLWIALPVGVSGQEKETGDEVFMAVEWPPEFPGGQMEMLKYIAAHVEYPDEAANQGITGRVMIQFVVNRDGSISDIKVLRSVDPLLDSAAAKVIRDMPRWTPGKQRNELVSVQMVVPVNFSLATEPPDKDSVYSIAQRMPSFPGGPLALDHYLDTALAYPSMAKANKIQGIVNVECIISKDGRVETAKVTKGIGWRCDEEALRLVKEMPAWNPGTVKGHPVRVRYTLAITFVIKELYVTDGTRYVESDESLFSWRSNGASEPKDTMNHLPYFPGGNDSMFLFIGKYLRFPEKARKWDIQGKVTVQFIVKADGSITNIRIFSTEHDLLNEEALRVVSIMPNWIPGKKEGKPIDAVYYLPINFVLTH